MSNGFGSYLDRPTTMSDDDRKLIERILADPSTVTRAEKNMLYRHPLPEEEDRLCQEKVGLTMPELKDKFLTSLEPLTELECSLVLSGARYELGKPSSRSNSFWYINFPDEDAHRVGDARHALNSDYEAEVLTRASKRYRDFNAIRSERNAQIKHAREEARLKAASPQWIHDMFDANLARWGFVVFRTAYGEGFDAKWRLFKWIYESTMLAVLHKCWGRAASLTSSHHALYVLDPSLEGADIDTLRKRFKSMKEQNEIPTGIATDCILIADTEVLNDRYVSSKLTYTPKKPGDPDPWQSAMFLRAIDPDYDASTSNLPQGDSSGWAGEITIPLPKFFDWLYYCFLVQSEDWETRFRATKKGPAELLGPLIPYPAYRSDTEPPST